MAEKPDNDNDGDDKVQKHMFEMDVLHPEAKRRVLECIEKRGKITITSQIRGAFGQNAGFGQQID